MPLEEHKDRGVQVPTETVQPQSEVDMLKKIIGFLIPIGGITYSRRLNILVATKLTGDRLDEILQESIDLANKS